MTLPRPQLDVIEEGDDYTIRLRHEFGPAIGLQPLVGRSTSAFIQFLTPCCSALRRTQARGLQSVLICQECGEEPSTPGGTLWAYSLLKREEDKIVWRDELENQLLYDDAQSDPLEHAIYWSSFRALVEFLFEAGADFMESDPRRPMGVRITKKQQLNFLQELADGWNEGRIDV